MFHRLLDDSSVSMVMMAERLSEYVLRSVSELHADKEHAHAEAILLSYLACRILQGTYTGKISMEKLAIEADRLMAAVGGIEGDA